METNLLKMKQAIMIRVRFIHFLKRAVSPLLIKTVGFTVALYGVGKLVFVAKVFENAPSASQFEGFVAFFGHAFLNTGVLVQAFLLGAIIFALFALRDFARTIAVARHLFPSRA